MSHKLRVLVANEIRQVNGVITGQNSTVQRIVAEASGMEYEDYRIHPIALEIGDSYSIREGHDCSHITVPPSLEVKRLGFIDSDMFPYDTSLNPFDFKLFRILKHQRIDIVHTTTHYGKTDISAKLLAYHNRLPHIHSIHTTFNDYFALFAPRMAESILSKHLHFPRLIHWSEQTKLLRHLITRPAQNLYRVFPRVVGHLMEYLLNVLTRHVILTADIVMYSDPFERDYLLQQGIAAHKVVPFMRGTDTQLFSPVAGQGYSSSNPAGEIGTQDHPARLIYVGRISDVKNVMRLADIVEGLTERNLHAHLTLVGIGDRMADLKTKLGHRVTLTGQLEPPQIVDSLRRSDLYIHPATHESFGKAVAEAKSVGLPLIGYASAGSSRVHIDHGATGFVAWEDTPAAWTEPVAALITSRQQRLSMARRSRADVETRYINWTDMVRHQFVANWIAAYTNRRQRVDSTKTATPLQRRR